MLLMTFYCILIKNTIAKASALLKYDDWSFSF